MKYKFFFIFSIFALFLFSCKSSEQEPVVQEPEAPVEIPEEEPVEEPVEEPEEIVEFIDDDPVELIDEVVEVEEDNEYLRSINEIEEEEQVSIDEFNEDKKAILQIIDELSQCMENFEYEKWKTYISPSSIEYYTNPANLRKAQKKLPDKTIQLKGLKDYFKYVFIPSRRVSQVEEIRYISKTYIKAVEVRDDGVTVVYYYFVKENNEWKVKLPEVN